MSYARFARDSDVYVFLSVRGNFECCGCRLGDDPTFRTTEGVLSHLRRHVDADHSVPWRAVLRLEENREENDAWIVDANDAWTVEALAPVHADPRTLSSEPGGGAAHRPDDAGGPDTDG